MDHFWRFCPRRFGKECCVCGTYRMRAALDAVPFHVRTSRVYHCLAVYALFAGPYGRRLSNCRVQNSCAYHLATPPTPHAGGSGAGGCPCPFSPGRPPLPSLPTHYLWLRHRMTGAAFHAPRLQLSSLPASGRRDNELPSRTRPAAAHAGRTVLAEKTKRVSVPL